MKIKLTILGLLTVLATMAQATLISWDSANDLNLVISDGNPAGIIQQHTVSGESALGILSVDVSLHLSGGYNSDFYGYLVLQSADNSTTTAILLNRMGTSPTDAFGSAGSGLNVTLSDSGTGNGNIHNATGLPTGIWQAGQASGVTSLDSTFSGQNANGTWTLFLADLAGGGFEGQLVSWGLDITVVPEPTTWALILFGSLLGGYAVVRRARRQQTA